VQYQQPQQPVQYQQMPQQPVQYQQPQQPALNLQSQAQPAVYQQQQPRSSMQQQAAPVIQTSGTQPGGQFPPSNDYLLYDGNPTWANPSKPQPQAAQSTANSMEGSRCTIFGR
jgi:hypothetical protein